MELKKQEEIRKLKRNITSIVGSIYHNISRTREKTDLNKSVIAQRKTELRALDLKLKKLEEQNNTPNNPNVSSSEPSMNYSYMNRGDEKPSTAVAFNETNREILPANQQSEINRILSTLTATTVKGNNSIKRKEPIPTPNNSNKPIKPTIVKKNSENTNEEKQIREKEDIIKMIKAQMALSKKSKQEFEKDLQTLTRHINELKQLKQLKQHNISRLNFHSTPEYKEFVKQYYKNHPEEKKIYKESCKCT